jgi:hypothetical protein
LDTLFWGASAASTKGREAWVVPTQEAAANSGAFA